MNACAPEYWLWLQNALGAGAKTDDLFSFFHNPKRLYAAGEDEWRLSGLLSPRKIEALKERSPESFARCVSDSSAKGYTLLVPDDPRFPRQLKTLPDMPLALFVCGDFSVLSDPVHIAVVGTREASAYGIEIAQRMSFALAKAGVTIVSGGALGIDSEAHAGAMLAKGRTICVLGCGLSVNYLPQNASLRRAVTRYGAVVSEFTPDTPASKTTFPIRNRLISGLSLGTLVIEAGERSGSLITARYAAEQGREIFAVPGDILGSSFGGANKLIQDGVKAVFAPSDILLRYELEYGEYLNTESADAVFFGSGYVDYRHGQKAEPPKTDTMPQLSVNAAKVFGKLINDARHIDELSEAAGITVAETMAALTELQLYGYAAQTEGNRYRINGKITVK